SQAHKHALPQPCCPPVRGSRQSASHLAFNDQGRVILTHGSAVWSTEPVGATTNNTPKTRSHSAPMWHRHRLGDGMAGHQGDSAGCPAAVDVSAPTRDRNRHVVRNIDRNALFDLSEAW